MKHFDSKYIIGGLFVLIIILGLSVRIFALGVESLWFDEVHTFYITSLGFKEMLSRIVNDVHPPFYFLIMKVWVNLFGDTELSLRLPSVVFAFLSIIFVYKLGILIFDREVGFISSLLLSFSLFNITYSQEARTYSLICLLASISFYYFYWVLNVVNRKNIILYLISSIILIYSHYYGVFILITQNIFFVSYYLIFNERLRLNLKQWIKYQIVLLIIFAPWLIVFLKQTLRVQGGYWISEPPIGWIIHTFTIFSGSREILLAYILIVAFIFFKKINQKNLFNNHITLGLFSSFVKKLYLNNVTWSYYLLILWLVIPILVPFTISKISQPIYVFRYTIVSLAAFYLLMAKAIKSINNFSLKFLVVLVIFVFSTINIVKYHKSIKKPQWRESISYIDKNSLIGDLLIFDPLYMNLVNKYYSNRNDLIVYNKHLCRDNNSCKKQFLSLQNSSKNIWIILSKGPDSKRNIISKYINTHGEYKLKRFNGIDLYYFNKHKL